MSDIVERMRAMANDFASDLAWCDEAADHIEAQAERIRVLREALTEIAWHRPPGRTYKIVETLESKALAALEATND